MSVKDNQEISRQTSQEKYRQEASLPRYPDEETPQEIQAYHIEYYVCPNYRVMDKHAAYDGPGVLLKFRGVQAQKTNYCFWLH